MSSPEFLEKDPVGLNAGIEMKCLKKVFYTQGLYLFFSKKLMNLTSIQFQDPGKRPFFYKLLGIFEASILHSIFIAQEERNVGPLDKLFTSALH